MANFLSTSLKNLFISLGASKTSDNNYAVPLLNATTKEPAGDMAISQLASVLGVGNGIMRVVQYNKTPWNTGIDVNTGSVSTHAYIYLASRHVDAGDATHYEFGVIRLGYDGNHATRYKIAGIAGVDVTEVSVVDSKLVITPTENGTRTFITLIC